MNRDEMITKLNDLGNKLYEKFGTESYNERCMLHDIKEALKVEKKTLVIPKTRKDQRVQLNEGLKHDDKRT